MPDAAAPARVVAGWPELADPLERVREACTRLRFHEGLRRRIPEAAAESRVRGAHASAELDGARSDLDRVRDLVRGAVAWPPAPDPAQRIVRGAVRATAESERLRLDVPARVLARLHLAAASDLLEAERLGRPRAPGETSAELASLGPAPEEAGPRVALVTGLLAASDVPALVVAALVHAEVALARPFVAGNGLVARGAERVVVRERGLDPTGVAVPEAGHLQLGSVEYVGALGAYATGSREGVGLWVRHCADALVAGAAEGERIADQVRRGRLG